MTVKIHKPTSPARRRMSVIKADISKERPVKSLITIKKKNSGRNNQGKITVRHRGGGAKRYLREVDFKRLKFDQPAKVEAIEYDPNRSGFIALITYEDKSQSYILAPEGLKPGDTIVSSQKKVAIQAGNRLSLKFIPAGVLISNIELKPGFGGKIVRSAGTAATVIAVEDGYGHIKMPSGEVRKIPEDCLATVGQTSNADYRSIRWGKAGRMRHLGRRPTVRGKAMNPDDHPHGGGEGQQPIGLKHPKTPWGKPAMGYNTRKKKKYSDHLIISSRKQKRK